MFAEFLAQTPTFPIFFYLKKFRHYSNLIDLLSGLVRLLHN